MNIRRLVAAVAAAATCLTIGPAYAESTHPRGDRPASPTGVVMGDQIPWAEVGPGWSLAALDQGSPSPDHPGIEPDHQLLNLIDPEGGRYQVFKTTLHNGRGWFNLEDWSADGRVALLVFEGGLRRQRAVALDLRTGGQTLVKLPLQVSNVTLRPDGRGLLGVTYGNRRQGSRKLVSIAWSGERRVLRGAMGPSMLLSPDGSRLVTGAVSHRGRVLRVLDRNGGLVRRLAVPASCSPVRWWDSEVVLASCWGRHSSTQLFTVPLDGGSVTRLTSYHGPKSDDLGDSDAYALDGELYLQANGPCGSAFLARQEGDGSATTIKVPGAVGSVLLLGTRDHDLLIRHSVSCDGGATRSVISRFNPTTKTEQVLTILPVNEDFGRIMGYGERRQVGY